jgi:hypothetical protein
LQPHYNDDDGSRRQYKLFHILIFIWLFSGASFFFSFFAKAHNLLLLPALVQSNEPSSGCVRLGHKKTSWDKSTTTATAAAVASYICDVAFFGSKVPSLFAYKGTNDYYELLREGKQCKKKERKKKVFFERKPLRPSLGRRYDAENLWNIFFLFFELFPLFQLVLLKKK